MASDALLLVDHSLALGSAQNEQSLALTQESSKRRRTGSAPAMKGNRWGLLEDKPYKPLPYVDFPVGLDEDEIDQFLREQRLEDLHRKIKSHVLEDIDPDIRPPSPPPIYDKTGRRMNTRDTRLRKAMMAEYNRLIRYMLKAIDGYTPPPDWKPQKLVKKMLLPVERYPNAPFAGVIIGVRGVNHRRLQEVTGCRIAIRGKDFRDERFLSNEEQIMPPHVHIEADFEAQIEAAEKLIAPLLNPESPEFQYAQAHVLQQVAKVNGYGITRTEQRCSVCGALGHLGINCPEDNRLNYKMANVVCSICGDKGHVASDCKQAMQQYKKDNIDWKEESEKKHAMNVAHEQLMSELGLGSTTKSFAFQPRVPEVMEPNHVQPYGAGLLIAGDDVTAASPPRRNSQFQADPLDPREPRQSQTRQPRLPEAMAPSHAQPYMAGLVTVGEDVLATASSQYSSLFQADSFQPPKPSQSQIRAAIHCSQDVDDSLECPAPLISLATAVVRDVSIQTGVDISLDGVTARDGQRIIIHGPREIREQVKLRLHAWLSLQMGYLEPAVNFHLVETLSEYLQQSLLPVGSPPGGSEGFQPRAGHNDGSVDNKASLPSEISSGRFPVTPDSWNMPWSNLSQFSSQAFWAQPGCQDASMPAGMPLGFGVPWDEL